MPNEIIVRPRAGLLERFGAAVKAVVPFSSYGGNSYGYGPLNGLYDRGLMNGSSPGATYDYATAAGNLLENSVVAACVDAIAQALADAPVILEERDGDDWHPNHEHPVVDLLRQPNGFYGASHLWHATTASECTTGNSFWRIVKAKSTKQPAELWWEQSVGVQFDAEHFITRYILYVDGKPIPVENDDIIHFRHALNPQNPRLGWTPLSTVMRQIAGDNLAATYHGALLRNSGVPSLLVSPKQGDTQTPTTVLTPDQVQDLMQKLMAKLTGEGAGKIAGSSLPVSIDKMAYSPDEMAIDKLINYYTTRICAALRVPPMVAGFDDQSKTYANYGEAIQDFWQRTIIPMQNRHANELNTQLLPLFGLDPADYRIGYDYSNVEVLQEDESAKWTMVGTAYKNQVIDRNEARVKMGFDKDAKYVGVFYSAPAAPGGGEPPETVTGADKENGAVAETKMWDESQHERDKDGKFTAGAVAAITKKVFDSMPADAVEGVPKPEIIDAQDHGSQYFVGAIMLDLKNHPKRAEHELVHEYAHHIDRHKQVSDSPEFKEAFEKSKARVAALDSSMMDYSTIDKSLRSDDTSTIAAALSAGKIRLRTAHTGAYLGDEATARKEAFAVGFSAHMYGNPHITKHLPELAEYFDTHFSFDKPRTAKKSITLNGHEVHFMNGQQPETETKADGIDPTDEDRPWTDEEIEAFTTDDVKFALGSSTPAMRELLRTQPNGNGDT